MKENQFKLCYKCKKEKSIYSFYSDKRQKDGKSMYFIECRRAYNNKKSKAYMDVAKKYLTQIYKNMSVKALNFLPHSYLQRMIIMKD
jgi:hypothetical protein